MPAREWKNQDEIQKILKVLRESKLPYTNIQQISDEANMHHATISKYITILVKEKKIETLNTGRWSIYKIRRK